MRPQDTIERALAVAKSDDCVVIADETSSANLRRSSLSAGTSHGASNGPTVHSAAQVAMFWASPAEPPALSGGTSTVALIKPELTPPGSELVSRPAEIELPS